MASLGSIMRGIGRGARAVGRGAMKGVLGFDDRDIMGKRKAKPQEEPDGDEINPEYSGYSKGPMMLPEVESDGLVEEMEMEAPPDIGMVPEEALIGLEMPVLPGMPRKSGSKGTSASMQAPKLPKVAAANRIKGQNLAAENRPDLSMLPVGLAAPGASAILDTEDSFLGKIKRNILGERDAQQQMEFDQDNPQGVNTLKVPAYVSAITGMRSSSAPPVPGLMNSAKASSTGVGGVPAVRGKGGVPAKQDIVEVDAVKRQKFLGDKPAQMLETSEPPNFQMRGGSGPMPYDRAYSELARKLLPGLSRPRPGAPGTEGPMPAVPGSRITRDGRVIMRGPNNQMGWELLP